MSMAYIGFAISVGSALYQRHAAVKAKKKAKKAADARQGFAVPVEGEIIHVPIVYGRSKIGGARVFHKVKSNYIFSEDGVPDPNDNIFLSSGGSRFVQNFSGELTSKAVTNIYLKLAETTPGVYVANPENWLDTEILEIDDPVTWDITRTSFISDYTVVANTGQEALYLVGGSITLTHAPFNLDFSGGLVYLNAQSVVENYDVAGEHTYVIQSYEGNTGIMVLENPIYTAGSDDSVVRNSFRAALKENEDGKRREFLFISQVICLGNISSFQYVDIDDKPWFDKEFGSSARIHTYTAGNSSDQMIRLNTGEQDAAFYPDVAHAHMTFKLDRKEPQYGGVPDVNFYIEGKLIQQDMDQAFNMSEGYSNNAVYVLLDYMTGEHGQGLDWTKDFHQESWWKASIIAEREVQINNNPNLEIEGKFWNSKIANDGGGDRRIKRYEFNGIIDTENEVRENVREIFKVIDQGYLFWSDGKYKLNLIYPEDFNPAFSYSQTNMVQYPPTPSGETPTSDVDVYEYIFGGSNPGDSPVTDPLAWKKVSINLTDDDIVLDGDITQSWPRLEDKLNYATVRFLNESKDFEEDSASWPPKFSATNFVHSEYLTQDLDIKLEEEVFINGMTSYHHALAYAEELVRSSRSRSDLRLVVTRKYLHLEPGDLLKIYSTVMQITGELLQVEQIEVLKSGNVELFCRKFDARFFAWNAPDDEVVIPRNIYKLEELGQARDLNFVPLTGTDDFTLSAGRLTWNPAFGTGSISYDVMYLSGPKNLAVPGAPWLSLGSVSSLRALSFLIPIMANGLYTFTVVARNGSVTAPEYDVETGSRWPVAEAYMEAGSVFSTPVQLTAYRYDNDDIRGDVVKDSQNNTGEYNGATNGYDFTMWEDPTGVFDQDSETRPYPSPKEAFDARQLFFSGLATGDLYVTRASVTYTGSVIDVIPWSKWELFNLSVKRQVKSVYHRTIPGNLGTPDAPTGGTWTFPDGPLGLPTGDPPSQIWTEESTGVGNLYVSRTTFSRAGGNGISDPGHIWSPPVQVGSSGADTSEVKIWKWATVVNQDDIEYVTSVYDHINDINGFLQNNALGWSNVPPVNPGFSGQQLWYAIIIVSVPSGQETSPINWAGATLKVFSPADVSGLQIATVDIYNWAPSGNPYPSNPLGNSDYDWATKTLTNIPGGWTDEPTTLGVSGEDLYRLSIELIEAPGIPSTSFDWINASITVAGVAGSGGGTGAAGDPGLSSVTAYSVLDYTLDFDNNPEGPFLGQVPPNGSFGQPTAWSDNTLVPQQGERMWMTTGSYNSLTGETLWRAPFWASLTVGSLEAISVHAGTLQTGRLELKTAGSRIVGGSKSYWGDPAPGMWMHGTSNNWLVDIGNSTNYMRWDGNALQMSGISVLAPDGQGGSKEILSAGNGLRHSEIWNDDGKLVTFWNDTNGSYDPQIGPPVNLSKAGDIWYRNGIPPYGLWIHMGTNHGTAQDWASVDTAPGDYTWSELAADGGAIGSPARPTQTYIADGAMDTLQIAGNAVTVPEGLAGYSGQTLGAWNPLQARYINWGVNVPSRVLVIATANYEHITGSSTETISLGLGIDSGPSNGGLTNGTPAGIVTISVPGGYDTSATTAYFFGTPTGQYTKISLWAGTSDAFGQKRLGSFSLSILGAKR